jgi:glyoxylase-like metal-dependent hydrolase (beta-lactamase superfamily II)
VFLRRQAQDRRAIANDGVETARHANFVQAALTGTDRVTARGDGIVQIRLPMAGNPLRYINGYILEDDDGLTLIDTGWKADDVLAALQAGLNACGYALADVRRLLITHCHFDHYGLAATLGRAGVAELVMHEQDWELARDHFSDPAALDAAADEWIARNGLRVDVSLDEELMHNRTELAAPTRALAGGERIGRLRALWTPGHTPGHLCFIDERTGAMFTGDHILDPVTPHVGVWRPGNHNPLGDYIASLHAVAAAGATMVFPAHGEPFASLARRVHELLAHEAHRERLIAAAFGGRARTAAAVANDLPWTRRERPFTELSPAHQQFAVAETLAHLEHLRRHDAVESAERGGTIVYARTPARR